MRGLEHLSCGEQTEKAGGVQPGEEQAPGRLQWGISVFKGAYIKEGK